MTVQTIIWIFALAFAIATVTVYYNTRFVGRLVRALLDIDALAPQAALTLEELGIKSTPLLKFAMRQGSALSSVVITTADGRYYISPSKAAMARRKYRDEHITILFVLLLFLIIILFALAATYIFPEVLQFFEKQLNALFN